ncbi:MAG: hypothetical protein VR65_09625 [Desulfobulbaceae bacterium BRH_c16a]|nr:MAG: hypothetical protein VR65_09625 [Desulfobulbaceae bacterium BRH_c16a]
MLNERQFLFLIGVFLLVIVINGVLASCTKLFYRNTSWGRLTHSQLLIRQGKAGFEHRLNVFVQSLLFSLLSFRIYLIALFLWLVLCGVVFLVPRQ